MLNPWNAKEQSMVELRLKSLWEQLAEALVILQTHAQFSEFGKDFVAWVRSQIDAWRS